MLDSQEQKTSRSSESNVHPLNKQQTPFEKINGKLIAAGQKWAKERQIEQRLQYYIFPECTSDLNAGRRFDLTPLVHKFIQDEQTKIAVAFGDSGAGKSLWALSLENELREMNTNGCDDGTLPIYIELRKFNNENVRNCINETLVDNYAFSMGEITYLQRGLDNWHQKIIFILDGFDEIGSQQRDRLYNLYEQYHLQDWPYAKLLVTCRTEYLPVKCKYDLLFSANPAIEASLTVPSFICYYIANFSDQQIESYLKKYVEFQSPRLSPKKPSLSPLLSSTKKEMSEIGLIGENSQSLTIRTYNYYFNTLPGLREISRNPFVLHILSQSLLQLLQDREEQQGVAAPVTRLSMYTAFVANWFKREINKLPSGFVDMTDDPEDSFEQFACHLAFQMFMRHNNVEIDYSPPKKRIFESTDSNKVTTNPWEEFFSDVRPEVVKARRGCPLHRTKDHSYSFIHYSFWAYFVARHIQRAFNSDCEEDLTHVLNHRALQDEPIIVRFLVDSIDSLDSKARAKQINVLIQQISAVQTDKTKSQVLENIITWLEAVGVWEIGQAQAALAKEAILLSSDSADGSVMYAQYLTQEEQKVIDKQSAATRLRADAEVLSRSSVSADQKLSSACWTFQLPQPLPFFVDREIISQKLNKALQGCHYGVVTQVATGLGGVGKTQLANYYAQQAIKGKTLTQYQAILWLYAEIEIGYQFKSLAEIFYQLKGLKQQEAIAHVYRFLQDKVSLIIFDNAQAFETLRPYLPPAQYTGIIHIIITSRQHQWGDFPLLEVSVFDEAQTRHLVEERLEQAQNSILIKQLHTQLGGLPLALGQAISYMQQMTDCKLDQRLARYLEDWNQNVMSYELADDPHIQTVGVTVTLSLLHVKHICPMAEVVLNVMAYLNPDVITFDILISYLKENQTQEDVRIALDNLLNYSLITSDESRQRFSIHRLVQAVMQHRDKINEKLFWQLERVIEFLIAHMPKLERDLFFAKPYVSHAIFCIDHLEKIGMSVLTGPLLDKYAELSDRIALFYIYGWRDFNQGRIYIKKALPVFEKQKGTTHPFIGSLLRQLARADYELGDYSEAQVCCGNAQAILENHPNFNAELALALNVSCEIARCRGQYSQAINDGEKARDIFLTNPDYGSQHVWLAHTINSLAAVQNSMGNYGAAKDLYELSLPIYRNHFGDDHPRMGVMLMNLGRTLNKLGSNNEAKIYYEGAIALFKKHWGEQHPETGWGLAGLSRVFLDLNEPTQAQLLLVQALTVINIQSINFDTRLYDLAVTCLDLQEASIALKYAKCVLETYTKLFAETQPQKIQEACDLVKRCELTVEKVQQAASISSLVVSRGVGSPIYQPAALETAGGISLDRDRKKTNNVDQSHNCNEKKEETNEAIVVQSSDSVLEL